MPIVRQREVAGVGRSLNFQIAPYQSFGLCIDMRYGAAPHSGRANAAGAVCPRSRTTAALKLLRSRRGTGSLRACLEAIREGPRNDGTSRQRAARQRRRARLGRRAHQASRGSRHPHDAAVRLGRNRERLWKPRPHGPAVCWVRPHGPDPFAVRRDHHHRRRAIRLLLGHRRTEQLRIGTLRTLRRAAVATRSTLRAFPPRWVFPPALLLASPCPPA